MRSVANDEQSIEVKPLVGEDAAAFDIGKQSVQSWGAFFGLLTGVLGLLYLVRLKSGPSICS